MKIYILKAGSSRPDREPKEGDPIRDPHKDTGRAIPSPDNVNRDPTLEPTESDIKREREMDEIDKEK